MGFLRDQHTKWRMRHQSSSEHDDLSHLPSPAPTPPPTPNAPVALRYGGGALGLTLQRSKSKWLEHVGPTKITWCKDQRLGITFHERPSSHGNHTIAVKEMTDDARPHSTIYVGMELIGVNGEPIAGLELATVMTLIRSARSPCELAFTPPPAPITVAEVEPEAVASGIDSGDVLIAVNDVSMLGRSLREVSDAISVATPEMPVVLQFLPVCVVFPTLTNDPTLRPADAVKKSLRNTLCIAAVAAALTV